MDTGRPDLNGVIKAPTIAPDEPVFFLRPKDPCAPDAVRAWAALAAIAGVPPATLEQALIQADRMELWPIKKLPGDDHLEPAERQQLDYQHQRRVWDGPEFSPWRLAELRGHLHDNPAALLRQLATEQQRAAALYLAKAARHLGEASSADNKDRGPAFFAGVRQAADTLCRPLAAGMVG